MCCEVLGICRSIWNKFRFECCGQCSTNEEQNEHEVTIQMVGNVFVLFCEIPSV